MSQLFESYMATCERIMQNRVEYDFRTFGQLIENTRAEVLACLDAGHITPDEVMYLESEYPVIFPPLEAHGSGKQS